MATVPQRDIFDSSTTFRTSGTNVQLDRILTTVPGGSNTNTQAVYGANATGITLLQPRASVSTRTSYPATGGAASGKGWRDDGPAGVDSSAYNYTGTMPNGDAGQKDWKTITTGTWTWRVSMSGGALVVAVMRIIVYAISSSGTDRELFRTTEQTIAVGATEANTDIIAVPTNGTGVAATWNGSLNADEILQHEYYVNVTTGSALGVTISFREGAAGALLNIPFIQEGATIVLNAQPTTSDTASSSDSIAKQVTKGIAETLSPSDTMTRAVNFGRTLTDTHSTSDSILKAVAKKYSDTVTNSDTLARSITLVRGVTENLTTSDLITRAINVKRPISETSSTTDSIAKAVVKGMADSLATSDTLIRSATLVRGMAENLTISDSVARIFNGIRSFTDTVSNSDSIAKAVVKQITTSLTTSDALTRVMTYTRGMSETILTSDSMTRIVNYVRTMVENLASGGTTIIKKIFDLDV